MFTGIVEELGEIVRLDWYGEGAVLGVHGPTVTGDAGAGDSIAVNGVCLTVVETADGTFTADVMKETLDRSTLGSLAVGDRVNLERAATAGGRLGGHLVQGHVDGVGTIRSRVPGERWDDVRVGLPAILARPADPAMPATLAQPADAAMPVGLGRYIVEKGSICVDGVSLTVVAVDDASFSVGLIPATLAATTLGRAEVGSLVNLEVDVIAKYVEKLLAGRVS